ncbi:MAG: YwaF family protein [Clostridia bacterium]|nr:YwaF family protein [Clostridia bacterium]
MSVSILIIRNIDIFVRSGWGVEVIPLQVCHIGSLITGFALIFKKKWLILTSFCFNMIPAILAMVFANSLANYDTLLSIRPQAYVWGHIFIVVCALYGIFMFCLRFEKKDLLFSIGFIGSLSFVAIICNSLFRVLFDWEPNYFYLFNYKGTPLKFLYNALPTSVYGWFEINWFYTLVLLAVFVGVFIGLYFVAKLINDKLFKRGQK